MPIILIYVSAPIVKKDTLCILKLSITLYLMRTFANEIKLALKKNKRPGGTETLMYYLMEF